MKHMTFWHPQKIKKWFKKSKNFANVFNVTLITCLCRNNYKCLLLNMWKEDISKSVKIIKICNTEMHNLKIFFSQNPPCWPPFFFRDFETPRGVLQRYSNNSLYGSRFAKALVSEHSRPFYTNFYNFLSWNF